MVVGHIALIALVVVGLLGLLVMVAVYKILKRYPVKQKSSNYSGYSYSYVRCPSCVDAGLKSTIQYLRDYPAAPAAPEQQEPRRFYDRQGNVHLHHTDREAEIWECSNGHHLYLLYATKCSTKGCEFGQPFEVRKGAVEEIIEYLNSFEGERKWDI